MLFDVLILGWRIDFTRQEILETLHRLKKRNPNVHPFDLGRDKTINGHRSSDVANSSAFASFESELSRGATK
jgi:hypothetical protein